MSAKSGQPAGCPGCLSGSARRRGCRAGWEAPEGEVGACQWRELGDVLDREAQPVVRGGPHRDGDIDRDVEDRHDEGESARSGRRPGRGRRAARCRAGVRIAFVVGVDRDQARLGVGRALIQGEVERGALGDRVGVSEDSVRRVEDDVLGGLGFAWVFEGEGGRRGPGDLRPGSPSSWCCSEDRSARSPAPAPAAASISAATAAEPICCQAERLSAIASSVLPSLLAADGCSPHCSALVAMDRAALAFGFPLRRLRPRRGSRWYRRSR